MKKFMNSVFFRFGSITGWIYLIVPAVMYFCLSPIMGHNSLGLNRFILLCITAFVLFCLFHIGIFTGAAVWFIQLNVLKSNIVLQENKNILKTILAVFGFILYTIGNIAAIICDFWIYFKSGLFS